MSGRRLNVIPYMSHRPCIDVLPLDEVIHHSEDDYDTVDDTRPIQSAAEGLGAEGKNKKGNMTTKKARAPTLIGKPALPRSKRDLGNGPRRRLENLLAMIAASVMM